jgi:signal peptidase II
VAALVVAAVVVAVDQITKSAAVRDLHGPRHVLGPFGLSLDYNSGSAFSLFTGRSAVLTVVVALLTLAVLWALWRGRSMGVCLCLGLVLGGALGNLCDRLVRPHGGQVVDFITLSHWPTFNVADACITVGVLGFAALSLLRPAPEERS